MRKMMKLEDEQLKKKILKKIPEGTTLVGSFLQFRRVSFVIVRSLLKTKIIPNQVSYLEIFLLLLSGILIATGNHLLMIIGVMTILICIYLDYVDGDLARAKDMVTKRGELLDLTAFYTSQTVSILSPVIAVYIRTRDSRILFIGGLVFLNALLYFVYSRKFSPSHYGEMNQITMTTWDGRLRKKLQRRIQQIFKINITNSDLFGTDTRFFALGLGCFLNKLDWVIIYFLICFVYLLIDFYLKHRVKG